MTREERLNAIWARTVEKLKEVVREFKITEDELHAAGDYINRLGQSGMGRSLVDVSLALTSVASTTPNTRAAHVHRQVSVGGKLRLTTQIFMPTSSFLDKDYVEGAVSDDLIVKLEPDPNAKGTDKAYRAHFDLAVTAQ